MTDEPSIHFQLFNTFFARKLYFILGGHYAEFFGLPAFAGQTRLHELAGEREDANVFRSNRRRGIRWFAWRSWGLGLRGGGDGRDGEDHSYREVHDSVWIRLVEFLQGNCLRLRRTEDGWNVDRRRGVRGSASGSRGQSLV
jgi:hypothetical protein